MLLQIYHNTTTAIPQSHPLQVIYSQLGKLLIGPFSCASSHITVKEMLLTIYVVVLSLAVNLLLA